MSTLSSSWLFQSVFYSWEHQGPLLKKIVAPLLLTWRSAGMTTGNLVYLSNEQGQHLRLAIPCVSETKEEFLKDLHGRINDHMHHHPSPVSGDSYQGKTLFMFFPNNSIHYNLFSVRIEMGDALLDLSSAVSEVLVAFFSDTGISATSQRFFLMCCFMSLCSVWEKAHGNLRPILHETIREARENKGVFTPAYFADFDRLFDAHKDQLAGLYEVAFSENTQRMPVIGALKQIFSGQFAGNAVYFPPERSCFDRINHVLLQQVNLASADLAGICHTMVRTMSEIAFITRIN